MTHDKFYIYVNLFFLFSFIQVLSGRKRPLVSSTNKTDRNDITEILLKVVLNTINQTNKQPKLNDFYLDTTGHFYFIRIMLLVQVVNIEFNYLKFFFMIFNEIKKFKYFIYTFSKENVAPHPTI
jgi:hypothetical protein